MHFEDLYKIKNPNYKEITRDVNFEEPTNIQFTSGTTGHPKATVLTHHNIVNNACNIGDLMSYTHKDRVCISVPLYHTFGMVMGNLNCISHRSTIIYSDYTFNT